MTKKNPSSFVHTNVRVFHRIAQESYEAMNEDSRSHTRPKPNGEPGHILTLDPEQKSFKSAFITIVFCGVFIESLLHLLIVQQHGLDVFEKYDRKSYEKKLNLLGCSDQPIMDLCKKYKILRREVVHEKAHLDPLRIAQKEAKVAIEFINKVVAYFKLELG